MGLILKMRSAIEENEQRISDEEAEKRQSDLHKENQRRRAAEEAADTDTKKKELIAEERRRKDALFESSRSERERRQKDKKEKESKKKAEKAKKNGEKARNADKARKAEKIGEQAAKTEKAAASISKTEKVAETATKSSRMAKAEGTLSKLTKFANSGKGLVTNAAEKVGAKVGQSALGRVVASTTGKTALKLGARGLLRVGAMALEPLGLLLIGAELGWYFYKRHEEQSAEKKAQVAAKSNGGKSPEDMLSILESHKDGLELETLYRVDEHLATAPYVGEYSKVALQDPEEKERLMQHLESRVAELEPAGAKFPEGAVDAELKKLIAVHSGNELAVNKQSTKEQIMGLKDTTFEDIERATPTVSADDMKKAQEQLSKNMQPIFRTKDQPIDPAVKQLQDFDLKHAVTPPKGKSI